VTLHCPHVPVPPAAPAGAGNPVIKTAASSELKVPITAPSLNLLGIKWDFVLVAILRVYPKKMRVIRLFFAFFEIFDEF